jgi:hypothetical protein
MILACHCFLGSSPHALHFIPLCDVKSFIHIIIVPFEFQSIPFQLDVVIFWAKTKECPVPRSFGSSLESRDGMSMLEQQWLLIWAA